MTTFAARLVELQAMPDWIETPTQASIGYDLFQARQRTALDDWIRTYASEQCDEKSVHESLRRLDANGGTLAYVANLNADARALLAKLEGERR